MNKIKEIKHRDKVYIYYSKDGEILRQPTGVSWTERNKNKDIISSLVSRVQEIVKNYILSHDGEQPSITYVRNKLKEKQLGRANVFIENIEIFLTSKKGTLKPQSAKDFKSFQLSIEDYQTVRKMTLTFDDITIDFINDYVDFLASPERPKKSKAKGSLNDNTISKRIDALRNYMKWIEENEIYVFPLKVKNYKPVKRYPIKIVSLSVDEQRELMKLKLEGTEAMVRDIFIFGCMTSLRYSDIISLTADDVEYNSDTNEYRMNKYAVKGQHGEQYIQTLNDDAAKIWKKYQYNLNRLSNQKFNLYLKKICKDSGKFDEVISVPVIRNKKKESEQVPKWQMIGSHTARRSFITNQISVGTTIKELMEMTSHTKIDTLMKYLNKSGSNKEVTNRIKL